MATVTVVSRLALAVVFAAAATAKLADLDGGRRVLADFAVPVALRRVVALTVPLAELGIAAALLPATSARWSAIAALASLAAFSVVIAAALVRGERPDCHCFGQLGQASGVSVLIRNGLLAALAVLVVAAPGSPPIAAWVGERSEAQLIAFWLGLALVGLAAATAWFGRELLRQHGRLLLRVEELERAHTEAFGLPVGAPARGFTLPTLGGGELSLDGLLALGHPVLLVFSDADCGPCAEAVQLIARAQQDWGRRITVALLSKGTTPATEAAWSEHALEHVAIADTHDLSLSYGARGTPAAVLVSREGRIDSGLVAGLPNVARMLAAPAEYSENELLEPDAARAVDLALTQIAGDM